MSIYTSKLSPSPKQGFTRFNLLCQEVVILEIDFKYDSKNDLQIYINSSNSSENPANNDFPKKWISYKLKDKYFQKTNKINHNLNHISFHPREDDKILGNIGRRTNVHFGNKQVFKIIGEHKDKEAFPFINFTREKLNGFVEHISIIQNFGESVRERIYEDISIKSVNKGIELGLNSKYINYSNYCNDLKNDPTAYEKWRKDELNIKPDGGQNFEIGQKYILNVEEISDREYIQNKRDFFGIAFLVLLN